MKKILKRPHHFTEKEDSIINELFNFCSTEKLSILMNLNSKIIIQRYQYLQRNKKL